MERGSDTAIVDLSALRLREATVTAGVWLTYVLGSAGEAYVAVSWQRAHRSELAALFGVAMLCGLVIGRLPRERIVRSHLREAFFLLWSALDLLLIALATLADGGTASPLALIFVIPVIFSAMSYPLGSVAAVGSLTVASYLALAATVGGSDWRYQALFTVMLTCAGAMSAWQARNHDRQRSMLAEISRADPLTGCLNRRGFEERAAAEIGAAARRARHGAVLLLDLDNFKSVNDRGGHAAGDELLCWSVRALERAIRPGDAVGRLGGDEFAVLFPELDPSEALKMAGRLADALRERAPASVGVAVFPSDGGTLDELMHQADLRLYASRDGRYETGAGRSSEQLSWAATLAHAVDLRMNAEHNHSLEVAELAVAIAARLHWSSETLGLLRLAAILHDVGKVAIPDSVLRKPGPLNEEEFELVKQHTRIGAELVSRIEDLDMITDWIRHSHEHFDGSGYPDGLRGEEIPEASRILLVADAFDAITSSRPYREGRSSAHARAELQRNAGTQFDPVCVAALLEHLDACAEVERRPAAWIGAALDGSGILPGI
ncbi:MAG TPA: diguanylate cyclase [Solirubrobacteraceae bacterium]|nr:diguanylate cyclase [Solirubrobacteraceae bacterium]